MEGGQCTPSPSQEGGGGRSQSAIWKYALMEGEGVMQRTKGGSEGRLVGVRAHTEWRRLSHLLNVIYSEPGRSSARQLNDNAV